MDATAFKAAVSAKSWKVGSIPTRFRKDCIMKYLVFIISVLNIVTTQSMYLDKDELRKVYSIVGEYSINKTNNIDYDYSLGISTIFKSNNEVEFLLNNDSNDQSVFSLSYKHYIKFKKNINVFFGANSNFLIDNDILDYNDTYGLIGIYSKFEGETLVFFPFIERNYHEENLNNKTFTTIGLSVLFYDVGMQPEVSIYDDGNIFYNFKFFLWEFR